MDPRPATPAKGRNPAWPWQSRLAAPRRPPIIGRTPHCRHPFLEPRPFLAIHLFPVVDPRGKLYVGGITEPGWMAQPDRGAIFRIDFTGEIPFEMQSIQVRPQGFHVVFTKPMNKDRAELLGETAFRLESYRYEYTGAYGSPELDRSTVKIEKVRVAADGKSVDLTTAPLIKDRVYLLSAEGARSESGDKLVHPTGAYTLNEIPSK